MSKYPTASDQAKIQKVLEESKVKALFKSQALEAKNKEAAKQQLLAIQLMLSRRPVK
jgi:hypothetical protein